MKDKQLIKYICATLFALLELYALRPIALWSGSYAMVVLLHIVFLVAAFYGGYYIFFRQRTSFAYKVGLALGIFVISYLFGAWLATWAARSYLMIHF